MTLTPASSAQRSASLAYPGERFVLEVRLAHLFDAHQGFSLSISVAPKSRR